MEINQVTVIGGGTMGSGIATLFAIYNFKTTIIEVSDFFCNRVKEKTCLNAEKLFQKEKITEKDFNSVKENISVVCGIKNINSDTDLVIEAINENKELKLDLFRELNNIVKPKAIFASNTSSISITELGNSGRPEKFIGMHFMNPVPIMKLVEIIKGHLTSEETYEIIHRLTEKIEKKPIEVCDYPGFISNRILMPFINEAIFALYEGVASAEAIDSITKLGLNHPMGPLALADYIGLDVCLNIMEVLYNGFQDSKYRVCPLLKKMVAAGKLGKKSGEGFFKY